MNESFDRWLATKQADSDTLLQAARYYLAERTDDLGADAMRREMRAKVPDAQVLEGELTQLAGDTVRLEAAARALLHWAWDDADERERVERAIDAAKQKLPIVEVGIIATVAMYGLYLMATGGRKRTVQRKRDELGRLVETETEYYPPPLAGLLGLFRAGTADPGD